MNWMNLPAEYCTEKAKFVILPLPYEHNPTYGTGAAQGAVEIIKASKHLEYYDEQFDCEPFEKGIKLLEPLQLNNVSPEEMINIVSNKIKKIKEDKNKLIISLGGDHAVTIGIVKGLEQLHDDFSVIILDAHSDFFHSWNGSILNHRCVAQRVSNVHEVLLVGVRSMDKDEHEIIENKENVHILKSYDYTKEKLKEILPKLNNKVYLSIDIDVFDPSFIRNTGTPEPGGLQWNQTIECLQLIFQEKSIIGADIVEFAPKYSFKAEAYSLAKLAYKIISLKTQN